MFCASIAKSNHFSYICFQLLKSGTLWIRPFVLASFLCQINNSIKVIHMYIHNSLKIKRKCWNTFYGTHCDSSTYLLVLQYGHMLESFKVPRKSTQPLVHVWIELNLNPTPYIAQGPYKLLLASCSHLVITLSSTMKIIHPYVMSFLRTYPMNCLQIQQ